MELKTIKNNRGNSIISLLSLMAVAVGAIQVNYFNSLENVKSLKGFKTASARNALFANIHDNITLVATYRNSTNQSLPSNENIELKACILGNTGTACQADVELPVRLYSAVMDASSGGYVLKRLTGAGPENSTSATPVVYKASGAICTPDANGQYLPDCNIEVLTTFKAKCAGGAATCAAADSISIRYLIKSLSSSNSTMTLNTFATIDQTTSDIPRDSILPSLFSSSSTNKIVTTLNIGGTVTTTSTMTEEQLAAIKAQYPGLDPYTVKALLDGGFTDPVVIANITKGLMERNFTDYSYINLAASSYKRSFDTFFLAMFDGLIKNNVTDPKWVAYLSEAGIYNSSWMKTVIDSGDMSNANMAGMLYARIDPADYMTYMNIIKDNGMANNNLTVWIAEAGVLDAALAKQLYEKFINGNQNIYGPILQSKQTDINVINQILAAITDIKDSTVAGEIARLGVTNQTTANTLYSLVSGITNSDDAAAIIKSSGGDIDKIKAAVAAYVPGTSTPTTTAEGDKQVVDPSQQTISTNEETAGPGGTEPTNPTLVNTCTDGQCPPVTY